MFAALERLKNGATQVQLDGIGLWRLDGGGSTVDGRATFISATSTSLVVLGENTSITTPAQAPAESA